MPRLMEAIRQISDSFGGWVSSLQAVWDERAFRVGFVSALGLVALIWLLMLLARAAAGGIRRARTDLTRGSVAERLGRSDARLDATVSEKLAGSPEWSAQWEEVRADVERAEAEAAEARRAKGRFIADLARGDEEVSKLLAQRELRASPLRQRYAAPQQRDDHQALLTGAAAWSSYRESLDAPPNLSGVDLCETDLSGYDLSGMDLYRASLVGARLDGADLTGADLVGVSLVGASLVGARLDGAVLARADLSHADLRDATLVGAELSRTCLIGARLDGARLEHARFLYTSLPDGRLVTGDIHDLHASLPAGAATKEP
ncbi:MAG: hypothetical protein GF320_11805 [Armatimonadia bacterium]|nr:hypothetical protein [Armatimonadia bacterium]